VLVASSAADSAESTVIGLTARAAAAAAAAVHAHLAGMRNHVKNVKERNISALYWNKHAACVACRSLRCACVTKKIVLLSCLLLLLLLVLLLLQVTYSEGLTVLLRNGTTSPHA
jgi:hypothetical protein